MAGLELAEIGPSADRPLLNHQRGLTIENGEALKAGGKPWQGRMGADISFAAKSEDQSREVKVGLRLGAAGLSGFLQARSSAAETAEEIGIQAPGVLQDHPRPARKDRARGKALVIIGARLPRAPDRKRRPTGLGAL
jgi:hypothetical protein